MDLVSEVVDDGVDNVEIFLEFTNAALVSLVTATELVSLTLGTFVCLGQLTDLTLDGVQAAAHRLRHIVNDNENENSTAAHAKRRAGRMDRNSY